jgi:putative FmdB family regulatory protein
MPAYDFRCRTCDTSFEVKRSIFEASTDTSAAVCPQGHSETSRVFTPVAVGGGAAAPAPQGGGCCGGGCCG